MENTAFLLIITYCPIMNPYENENTMKNKFQIIFFTFLCSCATKKEDVNIIDKNPPKPLNIVYIMADDHAYQAISAYGSDISKLAKTPNIDRIANEGARMDVVFVQIQFVDQESFYFDGKIFSYQWFLQNVDGGDFNRINSLFQKYFKIMDIKLH